MAFTKGQSGNPAGRIKGQQNRATLDTKEAFKTLVEGNLPNIELWLKEVAADNPAKALELLLRMTEFFIPKMKATDIVIDDINIRPPMQIIVQSEETRRDLERLREMLNKA